MTGFLFQVLATGATIAILLGVLAFLCKSLIGQWLALVVHVVGLALINMRMVRTITDIRARRQFFPMFVSVMAVTALLATLLIGLEATLWAAAYRTLGALPDGRMALLYSLNAITSYGHTDLVLAPHWRLMGALEALNGMLLFGRTTAFLYGHIRLVWPAQLK
jgi:hypothetical protein